MRRLLILLALLAGLLIAGCGGSSPPALHPGPASCSQAADGHGSLGACSPKQGLGLTAPRAVPGPTYPDRSNNDPCYCGATIKAQGHVGLIVKANQGSGFIDSTAVGMVGSARAAGLAVGVYDFDQDYTVAEARVFVARAHAAGIYPKTPNTFPLYLDVEFGSFNYSGLLAQVAYLRSQGYRVGIYTGAWYWGPHAGCRWPSGVSAWLSGYPSAPVPCGTRGYNSHQFTSTPIDLSAFLGSRTQFDAFVNHAEPKPVLPVCVHHRLTRSDCAKAKAQVKHDRKAASASTRAYTARGCPVLSQRVGWFAAQLRQHPRTRTQTRTRALRASQAAYRQRSCVVYSKRAVFFSHAVAVIQASR